jgi:hypothetical protein
MNPRIDAYAAGLLDGEGCVLLTMGKRSAGPRVDFGMTEKARAVLEAMRDEYGGIVAEGRAATEKWDAVVTWRLHGQEAARFLRRVLPHLMLKREQAQVALAVEELRQQQPKYRGDDRRWTDEGWDEAQRLHRRLKSLNKKGPSRKAAPPPPGATLIARLVDGEWTVPQLDLFSDTHSTLLSTTFPASGMTRGGELFALPMPELPTDAPGSSSLLPTPRTSDTNGAGHHGDGGMDLRTTVSLLPTPRAQNGEERNQTVWERPLDQPQNLGNALARIGASTPPPSPAGSTSSDDPPPPPPSRERTDDPA